MTSRNHNGRGGPFPDGDGRPPAFDGPGETVKGQPAQGRPAAANPGSDGFGEGSVSGMRLPADFRAAHFLDPAFLTGMANELYAEGQPTTPDDAGAADADGAVCLADEAMRAVPGNLPSPTAAPPGPGFGPVNWQDPLLFFKIIEDFIRPVPAGLPDAPAAPGVGAESYYFLPQPTLPPLSPELRGEGSGVRGDAFGNQPPTPPAPLPRSGGEGRKTGAAPPTSRPFHVESIRKDFPILHQTVHGRPLVWLDNAATTQKPRQVIDAISHFYAHDNSNIHRAAHTLAARATDAYEGARDKVRRFLGASQPEEIVFVHGATEGVNLVAQTYGRKFIGKGDEIVVTEIEHHANIVPWQQLAKESGAVLRVVPVTDRGEVVLEEYERLMGPRTKFVSLAHVSNALGTVLPVRTMIQLAHRHGARVLIDGAQSVPHLPVDVQVLDADFYIFSGHKLFGPTGIGVVYGKKELLEAMPPWQGGGNMIDQVTFEHTTYQQAPAKFEAGTGILAGAIGLGTAIDYLDELGMENIAAYEHELLVHGMEALGRIPGLRLIGTAPEKASVLSFVLEGVRTEDVGRYLDQEGIAVRAGHHCAQPTMRRFGVESTVRPSLAFYNTFAEIDALAAAIRRIKSMAG